MAGEIQITLFTDPACPFAFSAEPVRLALRWRYGDGLQWRLRMIVLTLEPGEDEKLARGRPRAAAPLRDADCAAPVPASVQL